MARNGGMRKSDPEAVLEHGQPQRVCSNGMDGYKFVHCYAPTFNGNHQIMLQLSLDHTSSATFTLKYTLVQNHDHDDIRSIVPSHRGRRPSNSQGRPAAHRPSLPIRRCRHCRCPAVASACHPYHILTICPSYDLTFQRVSFENPDRPSIFYAV